MNPMDYHVWDAMLEAYRKLKTKGATKAHTERWQWTELNWRDLVFDEITNEGAVQTWL